MEKESLILLCESLEILGDTYGIYGFSGKTRNRCEVYKIKDFNEGVPDAGEGILKGVNFLDAGFHVGVNTVGQSLRNANLNLRAEPPNPRTQVSPWMNSTIDIDLARKPLADSDCNRVPGQVEN